MSGVQPSAGDTGSQRSGGFSQGDAFTKREAASENQYIQQKEMEKLRALKAKQQAAQGDKK